MHTLRRWHVLPGHWCDVLHPVPIQDVLPTRLQQRSAWWQWLFAQCVNLDRSGVCPAFATTTLFQVCLRVLQTLCPAGSSCSTPASIAACAAGRYAKEGSLSCAQCNFGSYCPQGASEEVRLRCDSRLRCCCCVVFFARNSSHISADTLSNIHCQMDCPQGNYCQAPDTVAACPQGTFGNVTRLISPQCSGLCRDAPAGSLSCSTRLRGGDGLWDEPGFLAVFAVLMALVVVGLCVTCCVCWRNKSKSNY